MSISGISHLTFVVHDLDRTARLLVEGLGAREMYDSGDRPHSLSREKFFELGGVWIAAMEGEPLPQRSYRHVAFAVEAHDLPLYRARLDALGVDIRPPRPRIEGEGESLYFHDFDNHLFELHAGTLDARLQAYRAALTSTPAPRPSPRVAARAFADTRASGSQSCLLTPEGERLEAQRSPDRAPLPLGEGLG